MWTSLLQTLLRAAAWMSAVAAGITLPLRRPNVSVWRNWEVICRAVGLGAVGLSAIVQGGQAEPGSVAVGVIVLIFSTYCAHRAGELEAEDDRFN